jgi:hypothetical protein
LEQSDARDRGMLLQILSAIFIYNNSVCGKSENIVNSLARAQHVYIHRCLPNLVVPMRPIEKHYAHHWHVQAGILGHGCLQIVASCHTAVYSNPLGMQEKELWPGANNSAKTRIHRDIKNLRLTQYPAAHFT